MQKVYIVNDKNYDLTAAGKFGEVHLIYPGNVSDIFMVSKHVYFIKHRLKDMDSSDYLAVTGNMILCMLAFAVIMEKFGFVNVLLFNVRDLSYTPRVVARHQIQEGKDNG